MIVALAGRRIDAPEAEEKRFPLAMKDRVYVRIRHFFHKYNVRVLVSSAACGADLLAQKAARELEIEQFVILPFNRRRFRKTSVIDRPGDWGTLFDEICETTESRGNLLVLKGFDDDEQAYSAVTGEILKQAESLRSNGENEQILAVAVWEGKAKDERDETAAFIKKAGMQEITVKKILTR